MKRELSKKLYLGKNIMQVATLLLIFLFGGCAEKIKTNIKPYESLYSGKRAEQSIEIISIKDNRKDKTVSKIVDGDKIVKNYDTKQDIEQWYIEAFKKDFYASNLNYEDKNSKFKVSIEILEVQVKYLKSKLAGKNLQSDIKILLIIKKGNKTYEKIVTNHQEKWNIPIFDAKGFEKFLFESMSNSVVNSVNIILKTIEKINF